MLPADYLPSTARLGQRVIPPKHIPFKRPCSNEVISPLTRMVATFDSNTERAEPFHTQNAPHHQHLSSKPFCGRLVIKPEACSKKEQKSLVANQRIWLETRTGRNTLVVITDGSLTNKAAGWAITGIHADRTLFEYKVPLAKRASNHNTEMMALAHASRLIYEIMLGELDIREFCIFSDSTAALTSIFNPGPHTAQHASHIFHSNMLKIFTFQPDITGDLIWTPGHGGLDQMKTTDKNAHAAANMKCQDSGYLLPHYVSRSSALAEVETMTLKDVRNFLFLTCPTCTCTSRLPQTMSQTITTSHINHTQGNYRLPHHPDHHIPFPNHQSLQPTNSPSLQHQRTQPPIPKRIHPYPTGTHNPWHGDLGHLGHTGPGPFGTTVNHDPSIFNYNRIPGT